MTTPTALAELIAACAVGAVDDRPGFAAFVVQTSDERLASWLALRAAPPAFLQRVLIRYPESDEDVEDDARPAADTPLKIILDVAMAAGELRLFFARSLGRTLDRIDGVDAVRIADMAPDETFATCRARFGRWAEDPPPPFSPSEPLPDPRALARDFTGAKVVPSDIRPWLLRAAPQAEGQAFAIWRLAAARRLLASLADHVEGAASGPTYHFSGPPSRDLTPSDAAVAALFDRLMAGALWSFADGRDVDTRRLLLANEWVRTYRPDALETFGVGALDSARSGYDAYVKAGSRETLKALGELRKSVIEEAQKVSQRAQDMTSAMWRDLAVAAVPFVLKIFPDAAKAPNRTVAGALAFSAAAFLAFSYLMQLYVNGRYLTQQDQSRAAWRRSLNLALSSQEIEEISERPIRDGVDVYVRVRTWVGAVYLVLVAVLVVFAIHQLKATP